MICYLYSNGLCSPCSYIMSSTLERLRRQEALRQQPHVAEPAAPLPVDGLDNAHLIDAAHLEALVPGQVIENSGGRCYMRTLHYPLEWTRGVEALGKLLTQQPGIFAPFFPNFGLRGHLDFQRAVFLDTETTGLSGGAGVYCFMVGVGAFERLLGGEPPARLGMETGKEPTTEQALPTHFVVRQLFMRNPSEEGALLLALAELLDQQEMTVTFNGRTFDLPLLRTRLSQNQRIFPELRGSARLLAPDRPHLDLLHPARRLWRRRLQSCRLIHLEQQILGLARSEEDVPGYQIPDLYVEYMRTSNASELRRVFYHNAEDILSMVELAERLSVAFGNPTEQRDRPVQDQDWLALGQSYEALAQWDAAERAYRRALESLRVPASRGEAFGRLGQLLKRQARWQEATELWQLWLTTAPGHPLTPYVELAKYYEWQSRDLEQAEMWTRWALHSGQALPRSPHLLQQLAELEQRLARLQRKRNQTR
jgi:hypothetical protein